MKYRDSFYKNGCTEEIADYVLDTDRWYELHQSTWGNDQVMYVGWDMVNGKLWEIGVELYPEGQDDWCFHADEATLT